MLELADDVTDDRVVRKESEFALQKVDSVHADDGLALEQMKRCLLEAGAVRDNNAALAPMPIQKRRHPSSAPARLSA